MITTQNVQYEADGQTFTARLAVPEGPGPFPGVLIAHEGPGLDDVQIARADEMARLGYVGLAMDYHGANVPFASRDAMLARLGALATDPERTRSIGLAALAALLAHPAVDRERIAAIGFCFGAMMALEIGRSGADVRAIVGFHPGLTNTRPQDSANISGKVLMCIGADDPIVPVEQRLGFEQEMRAAGVDCQIHLYVGVQHSFTHPLADAAGIPGIAYDADAAARSWASMLALFDEVFGA